MLYNFNSLLFLFVISLILHGNLKKNKIVKNVEIEIFIKIKLKFKDNKISIKYNAIFTGELTVDESFIRKL